MGLAHSIPPSAKLSEWVSVRNGFARTRFRIVIEGNTAISTGICTIANNSGRPAISTNSVSRPKRAPTAAMETASNAKRIIGRTQGLWRSARFRTLKPATRSAAVAVLLMVSGFCTA